MPQGLEQRVAELEQRVAVLEKKFKEMWRQHLYLHQIQGIPPDAYKNGGK